MPTQIEYSDKYFDEKYEYRYVRCSCAHVRRAVGSAQPVLDVMYGHTLALDTVVVAGEGVVLLCPKSCCSLCGLHASFLFVTNAPLRL